jgi:hypothetical protein
MERSAVEEGRIVLFGTVDDWDSRTILTPVEAWRTLAVVLKWPVVWCLLRSLPSVLAGGRRRRGQNSPE